MTRPDIAVVGGGLAGVAAALTAAEAGAEVVLFEQRPHLGGAASSFRRGEWELDYGQHVFLRCCSAYRSFVRNIGGEGHLFLQKRLEVPVLNGSGDPAWLRRGALPAPLHLTGALTRYHHLSWRERLALAPAAKALSRLDPADRSLDEATFGSWLKAHGQSDRAISAFWDLIALPTLNVPCSDASLLVAARTLQMGLLTHEDAADIGWATVPLSRIHDQLAHRALAAAGVEVHLHSRVTAVRVQAGGKPQVVPADGSPFAVHAVIPAVEAHALPALFPSADYAPLPDAPGLGSSPIVNVHLLFDRCVLPFPLAAILHPGAPWVFDRSASAGLSRGQYLVIPISAADRLMSSSRETIVAEAVAALARSLPYVNGAALIDSLVIKDPMATIRVRPGTAGLRAANYSRERGVFPAGSWTDTGWPATMESAVRSGVAAARAALDLAGEREGS